MISSTKQVLHLTVLRICCRHVSFQKLLLVFIVGERIPLLLWQTSMRNTRLVLGRTRLSRNLFISKILPPPRLPATDICNICRKELSSTTLKSPICFEEGDARFSPNTSVPNCCNSIAILQWNFVLVRNIA